MNFAACSSPVPDPHPTDARPTDSRSTAAAPDRHVWSMVHGKPRRKLRAVDAGPWRQPVREAAALSIRLLKTHHGRFRSVAKARSTTMRSIVSLARIVCFVRSPSDLRTMSLAGPLPRYLRVDAFVSAWANHGIGKSVNRSSIGRIGHEQDAGAPLRSRVYPAPHLLATRRHRDEPAQQSRGSSSFPPPSSAPFLPRWSGPEDVVP